MGQFENFEATSGGRWHERIETLKGGASTAAAAHVARPLPHGALSSNSSGSGSRCACAGATAGKQAAGRRHGLRQLDGREPGSACAA